MKRIAFVIVVVMLIVGCGSSEVATPIELPTLIPLSEIDLESLLIKSGDLPAGFIAAQIRDEAPGKFKELPDPVNLHFRELSKDNDSAGWIIVYLYKDFETTENAYQFFLDFFDEETIIGEIGDEYMKSVMSLIGSGDTYFDLTFKRCDSIGHIRMKDVNRDGIETYAKRLDSRLVETVCR